MVVAVWLHVMVPLTEAERLNKVVVVSAPTLYVVLLTLVAMVVHVPPALMDCSQVYAISAPPAVASATEPRVPPSPP